MIKSKERILKHQYNRNNRIKDITIIGMNIIEPHTHQLELLGEHIAKVMSVEITVCPPHRIFNPEIYRQLYDAEFKEGIREFHGTPVFVELTGWSLIRWYLTVDNIALKIAISITIITMGVYLWLK